MVEEFRHITTVILRLFSMVRDSSVSTTTRYELGGPDIESRWGAIFSAHVQTSPRAHPTSYIMDIGSFPWGKAVGAWR